MCDQQLDEVESEKVLGIIFSKNLKVAAQCNEAYTKANHVLGLIGRTIKYRNVGISNESLQVASQTASTVVDCCMEFLPYQR